MFTCIEIDKAESHDFLAVVELFDMEDFPERESVTTTTLDKVEDLVRIFPGSWYFQFLECLGVIQRLDR